MMKKNKIKMKINPFITCEIFTTWILSMILRSHYHFKYYLDNWAHSLCYICWLWLSTNKVYYLCLIVVVIFTYNIYTLDINNYRTEVYIFLIDELFLYTLYAVLYLFLCFTKYLLFANELKNQIQPLMSFFYFLNRNDIIINYIAFSRCYSSIQSTVVSLVSWF